MLSQRTEADPMTEFFDAIKSPVTKRKYELRLRQFLAWVFGDKKAIVPARKGVPIDAKDEKQRDLTTKKLARDFVARAKKEPEWANNTIGDFLNEVKGRVDAGEIQGSTFSIYTKPLKLFCVMNDITTVNWAKLSRKAPKGRHAADDRPPSLEEVRKILQFPDPGGRIKPIVLTMLSSGIRLGSWDGSGEKDHPCLRWGDITPIHDHKTKQLVAASLKAYNNKAGRWYTTFITPEAYRALEEYMEHRRKGGETIGHESPVIRDLMSDDTGARRRNYAKPNRPVALSSALVKRVIEKAIKWAEIRSPLQPGQRRHPFKATHGFRKYFDTVAERHMKTLHVEQLLDHDTGLKESYNRPTEDDLLKDYLKAVPELTIMEKPQAAPSEDIEEIKREMADIRERMKRYEDFTRKFLNATPEQLQTIGDQVFGKEVREVPDEN